MVPIASGILLIADPFLKDPHFMRTVVLLCEHQKEGSFGLVMNRPLPVHLHELLDDLPADHFPVYYGGPVQPDSLHVLHRIPDKISGSHPLTDQVYWGGDMEMIVELIRNREIEPSDIRFFLGYSGWSDGQLQQEIDEHTWLTGDLQSSLIFHDNSTECWKDALYSLGSPYKEMAIYPIDPQLN